MSDNGHADTLDGDEPGDQGDQLEPRSRRSRRRRSDRLTPSQLAAVETLAAGGPVSDAAAAAGVERLTVDGWLANHPGFIAELNARRRDRLDRMHSELRKLADSAVKVLSDLLADRAAPPAVRLKVAQLVLGATGGLPKAESIGPCDPAGAKKAIERREHEEWLNSPLL
jgi:hypothetical protein